MKLIDKYYPNLEIDKKATLAALFDGLDKIDILVTVSKKMITNRLMKWKPEGKITHADGRVEYLYNYASETLVNFKLGQELPNIVWDKIILSSEQEIIKNKYRQQLKN